MGKLTKAEAHALDVLHRYADAIHLTEHLRSLAKAETPSDVAWRDAWKLRNDLLTSVVAAAMDLPWSDEGRAALLPAGTKEPSDDR